MITLFYKEDGACQLYFVDQYQPCILHSNSEPLIRKLIVLSIVVLNSYLLQVQTLIKSIAAPYIGLGSYSIVQNDAFSFTSNQASLAQLKNSAVAMYGERRFLLHELTNDTSVIAVPTSSGNFGLKTSYDGFIDYNETKLAWHTEEVWEKKLTSAFNLIIML